MQARSNEVIQVVQIRREIAETLQNIHVSKDDKDMLSFTKSLKVLIKKLEDLGYDVNVQVMLKRNIIS